MVRAHESFLPPPDEAFQTRAADMGPRALEYAENLHRQIEEIYSRLGVSSVEDIAALPREKMRSSRVDVQKLMKLLSELRNALQDHGEIERSLWYGEKAERSAAAAEEIVRRGYAHNDDSRICFARAEYCVAAGDRNGAYDAIRAGLDSTVLLADVEDGKAERAWRLYVKLGDFAEADVMLGDATDAEHSWRLAEAQLAHGMTEEAWEMLVTRDVLSKMGPGLVGKFFAETVKHGNWDVWNEAKTLWSAVESRQWSSAVGAAVAQLCEEQLFHEAEMLAEKEDAPTEHYQRIAADLHAHNPVACDLLAQRIFDDASTAGRYSLSARLDAAYTAIVLGDHTATRRTDYILASMEAWVTEEVLTEWGQSKAWCRLACAAVAGGRAPDVYLENAKKSRAEYNALDIYIGALVTAGRTADAEKLIGDCEFPQDIVAGRLAICDAAGGDANVIRRQLAAAKTAYTKDRDGMVDNDWVLFDRMVTLYQEIGDFAGALTLLEAEGYAWDHLRRYEILALAMAEAGCPAAEVRKVVERIASATMQHEELPERGREADFSLHAAWMGYCTTAACTGNMDLIFPVLDARHSFSLDGVRVADALFDQASLFMEVHKKLNSHYVANT